MPTTFLVANNICTDADLADKVGGLSELNRINKDQARRDQLRQDALNDAVLALASKTPPIFDSDLSDPTELKNAVAYRTLSRLYLTALARDGDRAATLSENYQREYLGAVRGYFTVGPVGQRMSGGQSFSIERR